MLQRKKTSTTQSNIIARPVLQKYFCLFLFHPFFIFIMISLFFVSFAAEEKKQNAGQHHRQHVLPKYFVS